MDKKEILTLINSGLYQDNLIKLIKLCTDNLDQNPSLYFTLTKIFESLESEYNEQGIHTDRYEQIESKKDLMIDSINNPTLDNLDNLIVAFNT